MVERHIIRHRLNPHFGCRNTTPRQRAGNGIGTGQGQAEIHQPMPQRINVTGAAGGMTDNPQDATFLIFYFYCVFNDFYIIF